jgi:predicted dehydrogenase
LPALKEAPSWDLFSIFEPDEGRRTAAQEQFARCLDTGAAGTLATAEDGLIATRIARKATDDAIAGRLKAEA